MVSLDRAMERRVMEVVMLLTMEAEMMKQKTKAQTAKVLSYLGSKS